MTLTLIHCIFCGVTCFSFCVVVFVLYSLVLFFSFTVCHLFFLYLIATAYYLCVKKLTIHSVCIHLIL